MGRVALLFAFSAATIFDFGCAESNPNRPSAANSGKYYAVTTESAEFFHYGPQQGNGPDKRLPRDTLMTLIRPSLGYAKVKLATGEEGYIASDDIRIAPEALVVAATATPTPARRIDYPEPQLPTEAPTPDMEPTPIPTPSTSPN
jgi:hypothetical protein